MITPSFGLTATQRVLPSLALDFTTAVLDPRVTFTRTTGASNPATYVNSSGYITVATNDQSRFDYDPVTKVCKGLLIEESRQNLNIRSENFISPDYTLTSVSVLFDQTTAPDNNSTADLMVEVAATSAHRVSQMISTAPAAVAHSVFVKAAGRKYFQIYTANNITNFVTFDIESGTVTRVGATVVSSSIQDYGNGWYRCTAVYSSNSTIFYYGLATSSSAGYSPSYAGDGVSGVYIWGAQVEAGSFATSYIPTTTTALTRNADVATMTGTNFSDWFNATAGTIYYEWVIPNATVACNIFSVSDGTGNNRYQHYSEASSILVRTSASGASANNTVGTSTANVITKVTFGYGSGTTSASDNGSSVTTTTQSLPSTLTTAYLGASAAGAVGQSVTLRKINYYPLRLTNAEVQAFSK
jgi:hypothetical protein